MVSSVERHTRDHLPPILPLERHPRFIIFSPIKGSIGGTFCSLENTLVGSLLCFLHWKTPQRAHNHVFSTGRHPKGQIIMFSPVERHTREHLPQILHPRWHVQYFKSTVEQTLSRLLLQKKPWKTLIILSLLEDITEDTLLHFLCWKTPVVNHFSFNNQLITL